MPTVNVLMDPVARTALYYDKGYSPDLTAFPRGAFVEGMHHAGLDLDSSEDLDDDEADADETLEASFARNRSAFDQLQRFEVALRRFIDERMTEAFGPDWCITQAPEGTSDNWRQKQATDAKATGAIKPLIEFADLRITERSLRRSRTGKPSSLRSSTGPRIFRSPSSGSIR